ncbi:ATP-binding protein [Herpetosiphon llansteffanensis]|uniref:ATP-binding protein n=1 Tax=Herpetosiphon llansteffanensis TaxID=2094568 RepID=UPI000D7C7E73|nr:ATP-binding protein [Herpetosiphon llansteffanensis]
MHTNPFVTYLNRYTTVSSDHEAAFDEFVTQFHPVEFPKLQLQTKVEAFVRLTFKRPNPPSIILTGNAGDGKTYLCRQIIETFTGKKLNDWSDNVDWPIEHSGQHLRVIKDFSEMEESVGKQVLEELAAQLTQPKPTMIFLLAANEGRLRAALNGDPLSQLRDNVFKQLANGPEVDNHQLVVINLNNVATSAFVDQVLSWMTEPDHWISCAHRSSPHECPIHVNAQRLAQPHIRARVRFLYRILEHLGIHVTIRDMLIHLAYTITGGQDCSTLSATPERFRWSYHQFAYYQNLLGESADEAFRRKSVVIRHLRRLNLGKHSYFRIDDFIVNGRAENPDIQSQHDILFAPQIDLGITVFQQELASYLRSGKSVAADGEDHALLTWLPHCRRKLFFELNYPALTDHLFSFTYLPMYFRLLAGDQQVRERGVKALVLGLNRAFTSLYLIDTVYLYITSHYAHSGEQSIPLIQFRIPSDNISLERTKIDKSVIDVDTDQLVLEIYPPPRVQAEPIRWPLDLLKFEYLMRRSEGSTADILARECELAIQQFKSELLHRFGGGLSLEKDLRFFAPAGNEYTIHTLQITATESEGN